MKQLNIKHIAELLLMRKQLIKWNEEISESNSNVWLYSQLSMYV